MIKTVTGWAAWLALSALTACSSHSTRPAVALHHGEATDHVLSGQQMAQYTMAKGTTSSGAIPLDHPAPIYPSGMLASCPTEIRLRALLIVDTDGKVGEVRIDPADGVAAAFTSAVRTAALQWRFEPLVFSRWTVAANHGKRMLEKEAKPFSLRYEFHFACRDGKPQTGAAATGSG